MIAYVDNPNCCAGTTVGIAKLLHPAELGLEPICRRRQPSQPKQNALYAQFRRMSISCGYLFFQHDRVGFLKEYLNS